MRVVSLFSGAGGLDLGFMRAGCDIVWANDTYEDAVRTYQHNIGHHVVHGDIKDIPASGIPDAGIVIGGFPCQGFSVANMNRSPQDGRNRLYLQFVRVVSKKQPAFFIAENVKGILSLGKGRVFEGILQDFKDVGYRVYHQVLNAADYGVPQRRERVFLLGVRDGVSCDPLKFPPRPTHAPQPQASLLGLQPWVTVGEALKDIPEPESEHTLENHVYSKYKLRFNGYLGHRKIDPDQPAPTITARGDDRGGVVVLHHPSNLRRMSVREAAVVQSFPLDYFFHGTKTSGYRQVANAVPPLLAEAIASSVLECSAAPESQEVFQFQ